MTDANLTIGTGPGLFGSKWTRLRVRSCQVAGLPAGFGASCWVAEARIAGAPPGPTLVNDGEAGQVGGHNGGHSARLVAQPRADVQPVVEHHYYYHAPVEASSDWDMWGYWNAVFLGSLLSGGVGFSVAYLTGVQPAAPSPTPVPSPSPPPSDDGSGDGPVFDPVGDIVFPVNTESGLLLVTIVAQDDAGLAEAPYALVGTSPFTIEESSGRILMPANIQEGIYSLVVQASDSQGQTSRQTIEIRIEAPDNAEPVLSTNANVALEITSLRYLETEDTFLSSSRAVGAVVGAITVQDAYAVRYTIYDNRFDIDDEGVITIAGSSDGESAGAAVAEPATLPLGASDTRLSEATPARQTQLETDALKDGTYDVTVTVTDISGNSASVGVTITIDTTPPSFGDDASSSLLVSSGASDTVVGNSAATDVSALSYSLEDDADGSFVIDGSSGEIRIASGSTLTDGPYEVTVAATDAAGNSASHDVTIMVETPEPNALQYLNKTVFGEADGQVQYSVADAFQGPDYTYRLVDGNSLPTGLSLNEASGVLTGTLALTSMLDAEVFTFDIEAVLNGNVESTAMFEFDVGVNLGFADLNGFTPYTIMGSRGDDRIVFGANFSARTTSDLSLKDGDNVVNLGNYDSSGTNNSKVTITAGNGDDAVTIGAFWTRGNNSDTIIDLGDGDNTVSAGFSFVSDYGDLTLTAGAGNDVVEMATQFASSNGRAVLNLGDGADQIILGDRIGYNNGDLRLNSGAGDDIAQFGSEIARYGGHVDVILGDGGDLLIFIGDSIDANITIDLADGPELEVDIVIFQGSLSGVTVKNVGEGDILAFPAGQIFDELTQSGASATINALTNDGAADDQAEVGLSFDGTVSATLTEKEITYDLFDGGEWGAQTDNFTVVTFGA